MQSGVERQSVAFLGSQTLGSVRMQSIADVDFAQAPVAEAGGTCLHKLGFTACAGSLCPQRTSFGSTNYKQHAAPKAGS